MLQYLCCVSQQACVLDKEYVIMTCNRQHTKKVVCLPQIFFTLCAFDLILLTCFSSHNANSESLHFPASQKKATLLIAGVLCFE